MRAQRFIEIGLESFVALDSTYKILNQKLYSISQNHPYVSFVKLDNLSVCRGAPFGDGKMIYRDEYHINEIGARTYAKDALPIFKALLPQLK